MKLALAADHAGYRLKQHMVDYLRNAGHEVLDLGVETDTVRSDYSDAAQACGAAVLEGRAERGLLICGSGVGASIAANKMPGIYAALCHDTYSAAQGVQHDNMNILCLGSRIIGEALAEALAEAYIAADFDTGTQRYVQRFNKVQQMERDFEAEPGRD